MDRQQIIKVLDALANGSDPATGAAITLEGFQSADTVRALFNAITLIRDADAGKEGKRRGPSHTFDSAGTPWSKHEEARLRQEFEQKLSVAQIGLQHGRSSGAIKMRLIKLGLLEPTTKPPGKDSKIAS